MLYIYVSCSSSLSRGDNINAFSVSGELLPKQQIPISSDTVTGYIGTSGNSWMTLQVARSSSQNMGCCTCFYIQFSISRIEYGNVTTGQVGAHTRISTTVEFEKSYSEAPEVFIQDVSPGGNVSDAINNKTIVFNVSTTGFTASSFNNTGSNFDSMNFFWLAIGKQSILYPTTQQLKLQLVKPGLMVSRSTVK